MFEANIAGEKIEFADLAAIADQIDNMGDACIKTAARTKTAENENFWKGQNAACIMIAAMLRCTKTV